ncbi:MAG TPA: hypothetical protein VF519_08435 [Mycobacteriales bacterium]|jgi:hypothetical protein
MRRTRRLALRRETLTALTTPDLEALAGGVPSPTWQPSCMNDCVSLDRCPTLPIRDCPIYIVAPTTTAVCTV